MPAPVIYYIRHGETAWNADGRLQGTRDTALNDLGRRQAVQSGHILADLLARDGRDKAQIPYLSSPLLRARATMELMRGALHLPPRDYATDDRLREIGYGQWEGFSWKDIELTHPTALADWRADPHGYCPPGGETHLDLRRRSAAMLAEIAASGTRTVVVGHGVSGAVLRGLNLGLDAKAMFVLEKPQDAFFRLLAGVEERIVCD